VNPWCSPQWIGPTRISDEIPYCGISGETSESLAVAFPRAILSEALPVPRDDGLGLYNEGNFGKCLQIRDSTIQNIRSEGVSGGLLAERFKTASGCRRVRFSRMSGYRVLKIERRVLTVNWSKVIMASKGAWVG